MPVARYDLPAGHAHVWWGRSSGPSGRLAGLLAPDERARHGRLRRPVDRTRFLRAHGLARLVLSGYLGSAPADLRFDALCARCGGPHGKPRLAGAADSVEFSISHAGGRVCVAVAHTPVGIDVEDLAVAVDLGSLQAGLLSPAERHTWARIPEEQRPAALRRYWVRKEAALKSTGDGLTVPLTRLTVSAPAEPARLIGWAGGPVDEPIQLQDLCPGPGFLGCLAARAADLPTVTERDGEALLSGDAPLS